MRWTIWISSSVVTAALLGGCMSDATELGIDEKSSAALPYEILAGEALGVNTGPRVTAGGGRHDNDNTNDNGGGNTNDNGAGNTNDNGAGNTNDNGGGNTNDNGGGNTNDNGAGNTNDNGAGNTNDNGGGNTNDNGAGNTNDNMNDNGGPCAPGSHGVDAELSGGGGEGDMDYQELPGGCKRFRARVDDGLAEGVYEVTINSVVVGHIMVDDRGRGELEFDTDDGTFPAGFPRVEVGDVGAIGGSLSDVFSLDCPLSMNCNGNGNGNDNGAGNTNDNGGANTNDNGGGNTNDNGAGNTNDNG